MEEITDIFLPEYECSYKELNNDNLLDLLKEFDLKGKLFSVPVSIHPKVKYVFTIDADIMYRSLKYLKSEDLKEAIPSIGLRAEFREKLFTWRKKKVCEQKYIWIIPGKCSLSSRHARFLNCLHFRGS